MKKFIAIIIVVLMAFVVVACGNDAETSATMSKATYTGLVEAVLDESLTDLHYADSWHGNTYTVDVWGDGIAEAKSYADAGDEACAEAWQVTKANTAELCEAIYTNGNASGIDMDVDLNVVDDTNPDNILLTVHNGVPVAEADMSRTDITYDISNDGYVCVKSHTEYEGGNEIG